VFLIFLIFNFKLFWYFNIKKIKVFF
jgi:hypothetical protein